MSISEEILKHCGSGKLVKLEPYRRYDERRRKMFLVRALADELSCDYADEAVLDDLVFLDQELRRFLYSRRIERGFFKLLEPHSDSVWEIKATDADSLHMRVFGLFAARDLFIATSFAWRPDLGDKESYEWKVETKNAKKMWNHLFPGFTPKGTSEINTLVNGVMDHDD